MTTINPDRLEAILARAEEVRVAVIGDLMLDVYLVGVVDRISPEAPVPVVHVTEESFALGGAANVAANVVRLGASCEIVGFAGSDGPGEQLRQRIGSLDGGTVHARLIADGSRPTTTKTRVMARRHQVVRFDREVDADLGEAAERAIRDAAREAVRAADVVVLEDYNKGVLSAGVIRAVIDEASRLERPVVVDPKFRNIFDYAGATVFKPNALELVRALGTPMEPENEAWLETARNRFGCRHLLVTLGEEGMVLRSDDGVSTRVPAIAREVFDVSGAGDTVTAFVAVALAAGATVREAMVLANFAAAIEVGKPGVATVSPDEVRELVARYRSEAFA